MTLAAAAFTSYCERSVVNSSCNDGSLAAGVQQAASITWNGLPTHRLLSVSDAAITFRWKDYAHGSKHRTMTLSAQEFLRRFLQHVLPRGFPRIRYFGWLANRSRGSLLPRCRCLLRQPPSATDAPSSTQPATWPCPRCQGPMYLIERLTAAQIFFAETRPVGAYDTS
ncbi:transposase [Tunturiibacter gelidiferens]|uniref:transposase n=1 Tax=Tunturiibacter gelidiferens TaxID=3069689 RepID=UPI003D9BE382